MRQITTRRLRAGYTTIEMVMVVVVTGVLFAMTFPRFSTVKTSSALRAGRQQLTTLVASARAAALLKGKSASLLTGSNIATVWAQTGLAGNWVRVAGPIRFDSAGLVLTPLGNAPANLVYDARGLLSPVPPEILKYELSLSGTTDTICISRAGVIMQRGCTL